MANTRFWVVGGTGNTNSTTNWSALTGGVSGASVPVAGDTANWDVLSGIGTSTINAAFACAVFDSTNFGGTFAGSQTITCGGATFVWGAGCTQNATSACTFTGSGAVSITSNGKQFKGLCTFNNAAGAFSTADAFSSTASVNHTAGGVSCGASFSCTGTYTHTAGSLQTNGNDFTFGLFAGSNANTRSQAFGASKLTATGTGIVFTNANVTGLTFSMSAAGKLIVNNATASAKTVSPGAGLSFGDFNFTGAGSGSCTLNGGASFRDILVDNSAAGGFVTQSVITGCRDFVFSGYTGTWSGNTHIQYTGALTFSAGMSKTHNGTVEATATSGTHAITSNGVSFGASVVQFNGIGGTWQIADAFATSATGRVQIDNGTLQTLGNSVSVGLVQANSGAFDFTNSLITVVNNGAVWNSLSGSTALTATGSSIVVDSTGRTATQTFDAGLGGSFPSIECKGTGSGGFSVGRACEVDLLTLTQVASLFVYTNCFAKQIRVSAGSRLQRGVVTKKCNVPTWFSLKAA